MGSKVTQEVAAAEVKGWLDLKKLGAKRREDKNDSIEVLVGAVMEGTITIDSSGSITQTLNFPTASKGEDGVTSLTYKPRLSAKQIQACLQGSKIGDGYGVIIALVAILTEQAKGVIQNLDGEDMSVAQAIANFFL